MAVLMLIGGKGLKPRRGDRAPEMREGPMDEEDDGDEGLDAKGAQLEAARSLRRALRMGSDEEVVDAYKAMKEACEAEGSYY